MATEDILIRYRADVSQLEADINKLVDSQEDLLKATKQTSAEIQKTADNQSKATKLRLQNLKLDLNAVRQIREENKKAFDPAFLTGYNKKLDEAKFKLNEVGNSTSKIGDETQKTFTSIGNGLTRIAGAFGIAFSLEAIIGFSRKAIDSFAAAEKSVINLRDTIVELGGESEAVFKGLNQQAEQIGNTTIFSTEQVRQAQSILSTFGLTGQQIDELIPRLAGFAKISGQDIVQAAQSVGSALDGTGKTFKNLGIQIDTTKTELENYNVIIQGTEKFIGKADLEVGNINDSLIEQEKISSRLTDFIGSKLADSWTKVSTNILKATADLIGFNENIDAAKQLAPSGAQKNIDALIKKGKELGKSEEDILIDLEARLQKFEDLRIKNAEILNRVLTNKIALNDKAREQFKNEKEQAEIDAIRYEAEALAAAGAIANQKQIIQDKKDELSVDQIRAKTTDELNKYVTEYGNVNKSVFKSNITLINRELEAREKQGEAAIKAADDALKAAEEFRKFLVSLDAEIAKVVSDLERRKIEVIPADSQKAQEDRIKALADLNEKTISDEIAGKIKLVQEDDKLSTTQKNQAIAKYEELKAARLALAQFNEQNELNIISAAQIDRIEAAAKQLDDLNIEQALVIEADKVEAANEAVAKSFEDLGKAISKADFEAAKETATARTQALNNALRDELRINITRIKNNKDTDLAKLKDGDASEAERAAISQKYGIQIQNAYKKTNDAINENNKELNDNITTNTERSTEARIAQTFEILDATKQLFSELSAIYDQFSEQRIGQIEAERDAQLESIDAQIEQNAEYLENRRISEEEAAANEKALQEEKVRIEAAAQKKIREEKRKQAILDKAAAAFEIGLATAVAIVAAQKQPPPLNAILTAIIATTSALQLAAVAAQPIPYRKGSKNTGSNEHLARVGEEGEELVWMPANSKVLPARQTKKYSDVIDAMYDNKLDDYVYRNYITPALMAQKEAKENQRAKSFAENMASSIVYNQAGLTPSDLEAQRKRGQYIRNVDEIADAIARKLPIRDIYRA